MKKTFSVPMYKFVQEEKYKSEEKTDFVHK